MRVGGIVLVGLVWVYGLAFAGFGATLALSVLAAPLLPDDLPDWVTLAGLAFAFLSAVAAMWVIWSWQIVKWRLWAYRRVDDLDALKLSAVGAGLIWPDGHFFERTEFRSEAEAKDLERLAEEAAIRKSRGDQRRS